MKWDRTLVTYHYVKIYFSNIIQLEVININVRNFKFPIGFNSNHHPLWTPNNMALTPLPHFLFLLFSFLSMHHELVHGRFQELQ
jgi:hypothetical protein